MSDTEFTISGAPCVEWEPNDIIKIADTGEVMRVTGTREGETRPVWRIPHRFWYLRWGWVPWRGVHWRWGGTLEHVKVQPHRSAVQRIETEQFLEIWRRGDG